MTGAWRPKRFWQAAGVVAAPGGGWAVRLDDRPVRTPFRAELVVPARAMAEAIAAEWQAQEAEIRPETMPFTRMANSALDKMPTDRRAVAADLAGYGASDLLCYRAEAPLELVARQAADWDPLLDWAAAALGAPLERARGVMPRPQPEASLARLAARVHALDDFRLVGFHDLVVLSGSLVLALAVLEGRLAADEAWRLSRLDEDWQEEQWGQDEEAAVAAGIRARAFQEAARLLAMLDG